LSGPARFFRRTMNPAGYHGPLGGEAPRSPYFEGWYFKLVDARETTRLAVIPGVFVSPRRADSHAFIQVLDGNNGQVTYHSFPLEQFQAAPEGFDVSIGPNNFNAAGITLNLADGQRELRGEIRFGNPAPAAWPVTLRSPGIMGWYAWVPFMQCYHGVLSFRHGLAGSLALDGQPLDFSGGRGYIEKDWGRSFPAAWIWTQTNHFDSAPDTCLTASIAIIPWLGQAFPGFITGLWHQGRLHRFATYTGARTRLLEISAERVRWVMSQPPFELEINAHPAQGGLLQAPTPSGMDRRIAETLDARVGVRLAENGRVLFEGEGRNAGLEVVGDLDRLRRMVFGNKTG
jgi:tocopherol cyclase